MADQRTLDADKVDRLKARFDRFRERQAERDEAARTPGREQSGRQTSERGRGKTRDQDQGLGD